MFSFQIRVFQGILREASMSSKRLPGKHNGFDNVCIVVLENSGRRLEEVDAFRKIRWKTRTWKKIINNILLSF